MALSSFCAGSINDSSVGRKEAGVYMGRVGRWGRGGGCGVEGGEGAAGVRF